MNEEENCLILNELVQKIWSTDSVEPFLKRIHKIEDITLNWPV